MMNMIQKMIQEKKDYREYKDRVNQLPQDYSKVMKGIEKYMWSYAKDAKMFEHIQSVLEMFENGASEGLPISNVIGEDVVTFADNILAEIQEDTWMYDMRKKLRNVLK